MVLASVYVGCLKKDIYTFLCVGEEVYMSCLLSSELNPANLTKVDMPYLFLMTYQTLWVI